MNAQPVCSVRCLSLFFTVAACTGSPNGAKPPAEEATDQPPIPAGELVLDRNPSRQLQCDDPNKAFVGQTPLLRLTAVQYQRSIADLVAPLELKTTASLPTDYLRAGFAEDSAFSPSGDLVSSLEDYAGEVAGLVATNLPQLGVINCKAPDAAGPCVDSIIDGLVTRAFRRPVTDDERARLHGLFDNVRKQLPLEDSLATVISAVLQSPQFLYRLEQGGDQDDIGVPLLDHEIASRLSYLIWNSLPDADFERGGHGRAAAFVEWP